MAEEKTEKTLDASHSFAESDNNEKGISTAAPSNDEPILVTWDGPDDPTNPKNWPKWRKWVTAILVSLSSLVTLMSSSMLAPALGRISTELHISTNEANLALSIYVLAYAFGPLILAPFCEVFGRKPVWLICSAWYGFWNMGCGFARAKGILIAGRFLSGLGGSVSFVVSMPVISDCWRPEERGISFAIVTFIPLLGPALGPVMAGVVTGSIGWPWLFWVMSIFNALVLALALVVFRETHNATILSRKAKHLTKLTGRPHHTEYQGPETTLSHRLKVGLTRPFRLFVTQPIIQIMSLFLAVNFGLLFIVVTSFAGVWIELYHETVTISGLNYLAMVIGYTIASQVGGRVTDRIWKHLQKKHGGATAPEYRVPLMIPSIILIPAGLFWYGWAVQAHAHWAVVDVGIGVFGCGIIVGTQSMQAYVVDSFPQYVASATAASQFLRNIFAFVFPIFAPQLYRTLGQGWGNSLLAFLYLGIGLPAPFILWLYGAKLRAKGKPQL